MSDKTFAESKKGMTLGSFFAGFHDKGKSVAHKYHAARNAHETRTIVRNTQKKNVLKSRTAVEEERARIARAKRSQRRSNSDRMPHIHFGGKARGF